MSKPRELDYSDPATVALWRAEKISRLIVQTMTDEQLERHIKELNRTRRRFAYFSLNGHMVWKTRKTAREDALREKKARELRKQGRLWR